MGAEFLIASPVVVVPPGTGALHTLSTGFSRGARAGVVAAFGCTPGVVPHMAAAVTGLAAALHASAVAFRTLRCLGVACLLHMAWNTLREQGALRVIASAILISALNPKLSILFLAFLPQFVSAGAAHSVTWMLG